MSKNGRMKKKCELYKKSGHREENKHNRQLKHQKKLEYFAKRKKEGKTYVYKPNPYKKDTSNYETEQFQRAEKIRLAGTHKDNFSKLKSIFRKLDNYLEHQALLEKQLQDKNKK